MTKGRIFQKRIVADLSNRQNLCVDSPTVRLVTDRKTGESLTAQEALGSDPQRLQNLRLESATRSLKHAGLKTPYFCSICHTGLRIACSPNGQSFFFKHIVDDNSCPQRNNLINLSRDQIKAAQYNSAKESDAHRQIKHVIKNSLEADINFSEIFEEKTWRSNNSFEIRRPDVQALLNGKDRIAFEVQLSTTFLDVIAARRYFYLQNNAFIFWIFKDFDIENALMTKLDVFYSNRCNAFIANEDTLTISINTGKFHLFCVWAEPQLEFNKITHIIKKKIISFDEITLDRDNQSAFIYNYDFNKNIIYNEYKRKIFFSKYTWAINEYEAIELFKSIITGFNIDKNLNIRSYLTFVAALLSAKNGHYDGWGFNNNDSVFHHLYDIRKELIIMYCVAVNTYKNSFTDKRGKIARRKHEIWDDIQTNREKSIYYPAKQLEFIVEILFPEVHAAYQILRAENREYFKD